MRPSHASACRVASRLLDEKQVRVGASATERVLRDFDPLWKRLNDESRARVVRALIDEVRVDEQHGPIGIAFRTGDATPRAA